MKERKHLKLNMVKLYLKKQNKKSNYLLLRILSMNLSFKTTCFINHNTEC